MGARPKRICGMALPSLWACGWAREGVGVVKAEEMANERETVLTAAHLDFDTYGAMSVRKATQVMDMG